MNTYKNEGRVKSKVRKIECAHKKEGKVRKSIRTKRKDMKIERMRKNVT